MIKLKDLILEAKLKSINIINNNVMTKILLATQKQYDQWNQNEEGYDEELGAGGICHLIADDIAGILNLLGIESSTVSSTSEQHVYVVSKFKEGVFLIDVPYYHYESGGGFTWKKLPDIKFDDSHVVIRKLDSNPKNFFKYIDQY